MTPREFFDSKPHGTIKNCMQKTGFCASTVSLAINGKRKCSPFVAQCIEAYAGVKLDWKKDQVRSKKRSNK